MAPASWRSSLPWRTSKKSAGAGRSHGFLGHGKLDPRRMSPSLTDRKWLDPWL